MILSSSELVGLLFVARIANVRGCYGGHVTSDFKSCHCLFVAVGNLKRRIRKEAR